MIKRIKIRDFKSIRDVDLKLDPVTVLIGRSGTGKSNLVQAIRFLRNLLLNQEQAINFELGWDRIIPAGEANPRTAIEVTFSVPGEEREYNYRIAFGRDRSPMSLREESLSLGDEILFSRSRTENAQWKWEKNPKLAPEPYQVDVPMLGKFPSLQEIVLAYAALSNGIGYYHFPDSTLVPSSIPDRNRELLQAIPGLDDDAINYKIVMRAIAQDFHHPNIRKSLLATLRAVNSSIKSVELDSLTNPQRAVIGHEAGDRVFALSLEQESDGLRRFYAHLLALYQTPPKLTLVFEEPENAIFPGALSLLADEFKAAPREKRGQVILTTHNPILLDCFAVENLRVVEMKDGNTIVGPVTKEQRDAVKDHLLTTGELLTVEKPRLENEPEPEPCV